MSFGSQTVGFISIVGTGEYDELGAEIVDEVAVPEAGCRHRPLRAEEMPEALTNIATQVWKTTAPSSAAAKVAASTGVLEVDGVRYEIIGGAQPFEDFSDPFKVTILSKIQAA